MTLTLAHYLEHLVTRSSELRYVWNESDLRWVYTVPDTIDLKSVPWALWVDAAISGLTIATIEWVIFRLMPFQADPTPQQAVQAAWCANIDRHYCQSLEFDRRKWTGSIRSPLLTCVNLMHEALFESLDSGIKPVHCPVLSAQLVEHICAESRDAFAAWRTQIVDRLDQFYRTPDPLIDLYGEVASKMVVPPQAFDPQVDFHIKDAPELADAFLRNVDYPSNPLLVLPEQMRQDGFEGIPYRYIQVGEQ